ncbi:Metallo-dependent phosphatase-like protein [Gautieria morchelliformis]|nr:Metallo-dependent phosphatase-like protein [Gautieria morchelliformis]
MDKQRRLILGLWPSASGLRLYTHRPCASCKMTMRLRILHFNDVYRVTPQKSPSGTISVSQFAHLLSSLSSEAAGTDILEKPLLLFSGDVFSPSIESTITRGSHMVPVMNAFGVDVALTGNHDFDFGYPHLTKLVKDCTFPWILSNIYDTDSGNVPDTLQEFVVLERPGLKIGIIGLVEKEWIETVSSWPPNFKYRDMTEVGVSLSKALRDVDGKWACDIVIALTHSRLPNDIALAKALYARPSSADGVAMTHGVDIILGGHDHLYYVSKGCQSWEGYDLNGIVPLGAEDDDGILAIKSGTDFRDLSELTLELEDGPPGAARRRVVKSVVGKRHTVTPDTKSSTELESLLATILSSVSTTLGSPLCKVTTPLDLRSELIRTEESAAGNWFADVLLHAYDEALCMQGSGGADAVIICAGSLRGDSVYGPGIMTLGDILEILPFDDSVVVLEVSGEAIWDAFESSLRTWPAQEGRFPIVSAFHIHWDSRKPPGQRILDICLEIVNSKSELVLEKVKREPGRLYRIVTREYMAQGHDGFGALKGSTYLIDEEHGMPMSTLVRRYLLGFQYIHTMRQRSSIPPSEPHLHHETSGVLSRARSRWQDLGNHILSSRKHKLEVNQDAHKVSGREHMQCVDCFDGGVARQGAGLEGKGTKASKDAFETGKSSYLIEIQPEVDGRLTDIGRASKH